ncbi:PAS domain-containing protein [Candidatus Roizmanbacteria bacterium]|nr:PAS domain-containing protein [Candidatus Roizmanbacteria bacterium]
MHNHNDHSDLVKGFVESQKEVFDSSDQAMYVFLDDDSRACNEKFAQLLGYSSADEWMKVDVKGAFPSVFVDGKSQETLVSSYQKVMEKKTASSFKVTWKKKTGGTVDTTVILIPVVYQDHLFALHFVS